MACISVTGTGLVYTGFSCAVGSAGVFCAPLLLGEGLLPHGQMLLVFHQTQEGGARLDPQAIVVVFRVAPDGNRQRAHRNVSCSYALKQD